MGLEIEFEYDDTPDGTWSPARDAQPREQIGRRLPARPRGASALVVNLGIALTGMAVGAASTAGLLSGNAAESDRTIASLHLAPLGPFTVQALPDPPAAPTADVLLATPWTNAFDRDVTLSVINDGPDPVTVLDAAVGAMQFQVTELTPQSTEPTAPGAVSVLRGRAHIVCGDYPAPDESATIARLRARTADGQVRGETLMVDRSSGITEQAVCAHMATPQILRSTAFAAPASGTPGTYVVDVTATNRAPFPLRMRLPESAVANWTSGGGLAVAASGDVVIAPRETGTIAITVKVTDCSIAIEAASDGFDYETLAFSDARDAPDYPQTRFVPQSVALADRSAIMTYCLGQERRTLGRRSGHRV